MAEHPKEKRKKRLNRIAFAAFLLSLGAAGWFLIALLVDLMNSRLLSISPVAFAPPIAVFLCLYAVRKYVEKEAETIMTEREAEEQQRRDLAVAHYLTHAGRKP